MKRCEKENGSKRYAGFIEYPGACADIAFKR